MIGKRKQVKVKSGILAERQIKAWQKEKDAKYKYEKVQIYFLWSHKKEKGTPIIGPLPHEKVLISYKVFDKVESDVTASTG
jgi:hypothetical protein